MRSQKNAVVAYLQGTRKLTTLFRHGPPTLFPPSQPAQARNHSPPGAFLGSHPPSAAGAWRTQVFWASALCGGSYISLCWMCAHNTVASNSFHFSPLGTLVTMAVGAALMGVCAVTDETRPTFDRLGRSCLLFSYAPSPPHPFFGTFF